MEGGCDDNIRRGGAGAGALLRGTLEVTIVAVKGLAPLATACKSKTNLHCTCKWCAVAPASPRLPARPLALSPSLPLRLSVHPPVTGCCAGKSETAWLRGARGAASPPGWW